MEATSPLKAIRLKCLDCCNNQIKEVRLCPVTGCPLYNYRNGHKPKNTQKNEGFLIPECLREDSIKDSIPF